MPERYKKDLAPTTPSLIIPVYLDQAMSDYGIAIDGFSPPNPSGGFERMFYLGAVPITTLGFDDILPISSRARYAVCGVRIVSS